MQYSTTCTINGPDTVQSAVCASAVTVGRRLIHTQYSVVFSRIYGRSLWFVMRFRDVIKTFFDCRRCGRVSTHDIVEPLDGCLSFRLCQRGVHGAEGQALSHPAL